MNLFHFFLIATLTLNLSAAEIGIQWVRSTPSNYEYDYSRNHDALAKTFEGDLVWAGVEKHKKFLNYESSGNLFLKQMNSSGGVLFEKHFVGTANVFSMVVTTKGILVTGELEGTLLDGTRPLCHSKKVAPYVLLLDERGKVISSSLFEDLGTTGFLLTLTTDRHGNFYVFGTSPDGSSYLKRFNFKGKVSTILNQKNVNALDTVAIDKEGNIFVAGSTGRGNLDFNGKALSTEDSYQNYIAKYGPDGVNRWVHILKNVRFFSQTVHPDQKGGVYFAGAAYGKSSIAGVTIEEPEWIYGYFVTKLNANGEVVWLKQPKKQPKEQHLISGDIDLSLKNNMDLDTYGNVYLTGFTRKKLQWENGITTEVNYQGLVALKYNTDGDLQWVLTAENEARYSDGIQCIGEDSCYLIGKKAIALSDNPLLLPVLMRISK